MKYEHRNEKGELHCVDGPAFEHDNGTKGWYINGKLHRIDGPAAEHVDGTKEWWVNGELHRLDGPAVEHSSGLKEWWVNGKKFNPNEHLVEIPSTEEEKISFINTIKFIKIDDEFMIMNQWLKMDVEFYNKYRLLFGG